MEPRRRFRFLKQLSEGTFGKVYMSEMITDSNFSKVVAIKILHGKWVDHEEIVQRSRDEARVLGLLNHRNIIRVEDLTSIKGKCAIIMEYLDGIDLKTLITHCREQGRLIPLKVTLDIIEAVTSAMNGAYNAKPLQGGEPLRLIHRDIKPSNVMLTKEGEVKVLDFGTAQAKFEEREAKTQALAFGSAAYMAPERLFGEPDRPSGDVFSLGVTFFELVTCTRFGKVSPKPEKFESELAIRLVRARESLDRYETTDAVKDGIMAALQELLAYHHEERPELQALQHIMESISTQVNDGSLRKFCREVVSICKVDHVPSETDDQDPLEGTILFEDASSTFSSDFWDEESEHDVPAINTISEVNADSTMPVNKDQVDSNAFLQADSTIVERPSGSGARMLVLVTLLLMSVAALCYYFLVMVPEQEKSSQVELAKTVQPKKKAPPKSKAVPEKEEEKLEAPGPRKIDMGHEGGVSVTLTFSRAIDGIITQIKYRQSADIEYKMPSKVREMRPLWNGDGQLTLENVPQGRFRMVAKGPKIETNSFEVKSGKKTCEYELTINNGWKGSCSK